MVISGAPTEFFEGGNLVRKATMLTGRENVLFDEIGEVGLDPPPWSQHLCHFLWTYGSVESLGTGNCWLSQNKEGGWNCQHKCLCTLRRLCSGIPEFVSLSLDLQPASI
jgi:hypothetical protein